MAYHLKCAKSYADHGGFDGAIREYTAVIDLDPNFAKGYYNRALFFKAEGQNAQAQADFAKAKQLGYTGPE